MSEVKNKKRTDWTGCLGMTVIDIIFNREAGWSKTLTKKIDDFLSEYKKAVRDQRDKEIVELLNNTVMQHVEDVDNSLHVRILKDLIKNLNN